MLFYAISSVAARTASVDIKPDVNATAVVTGSVTLKQPSPYDQVEITVNVKGLAPGSTHGWHIHAKGVAAGAVNCTTTAGHFNPLNVTHGGRTAAVRHFGDLGNFVADYQGNVNVVIKDPMVTLYGKYNVTGLAVVIHEKADDLGLGNATTSKTSGNAGARLACGNIVVAAYDDYSNDKVYDEEVPKKYPTGNPKYAEDEAIYSSAIVATSLLFGILVFLN